MGIDRPHIADAIADIGLGLKKWPIWLFLSWTDIRLRYRRTVIGPLWMTILTGVTIAAMGVVWGILFKADLKSFFPYLAAGLVIWSLITTIVTESAVAIIDRPDNLKDFNLPITCTALRLVMRNFIVFLHNIIVYFAVAALFGIDLFTPALLFALPGLFLLLFNGTWVAISLGIIGARFRDIQQLVIAFMTILFLVSPILWQRDALGTSQFIATLNPITHFLEIVRTPLLGQVPSSLSLTVVVGITVMGWAGTIYLLARTRRQIVYWL